MDDPLSRYPLASFRSFRRRRIMSVDHIGPRLVPKMQHPANILERYPLAVVYGWPGADLGFLGLRPATY